MLSCILALSWAAAMPLPAGTDALPPEATPSSDVADAPVPPEELQTTEEPGAEIEVEVVATHEWPVKVDVVTAEAVEGMVNAPYVADVLERLPGTDTLTGCPAGAPLITIRGNNSEWTQILLEGIPLNPIGRPYVLNFIPMAAVDEVRVIKGPAPPKYPGTTIAGLVLLDMKTGDRYPGVDLSATIGDYGQRILDLNFGAGDAERSCFFSFTHSEMDGWLPHCDMDLNSLSTKFVLTPDDSSKLTVVGAHLFGEKFGPRPNGPNPAGKWAAEWTDISQPKLSITYERALRENSDLRLCLAPYWFSGTQLWQQWFGDHQEPRFMPWDYQLLRADLQHDTRTQPDRIWSWGITWQEDVYSYAGPMPTGYWGAIPADKWKEFEKRATSVFVQHSLPAGTDGTLTLGGRYDTEDPGDSIAAPFVSWHQRLNRDTRLRLALTRNKRFPKLMELFGQGMWVGNPALEPELGWTYQADVSWALGSGALDASVFNSDLEDLIVADENNVFTNVGEARVRGLELSWRKPWRQGSWWANYTYLDATNTVDDRPLVVAFRTAFPRHSAKAGVSLRDGHRGEHSMEVLAYGDRRTDVGEPTYVGDPWNVTVPTHLPGFTWVNYKYTRQLSKNAKLSLGVENIFDKQAEDLLFYERPGRWVSGTLTFDF
jgi:outer membrane receptor protein involved in Fe transport